MSKNMIDNIRTSRRRRNGKHIPIWNWKLHTLGLIHKNPDRPKQICLMFVYTIISNWFRMHPLLSRVCAVYATLPFQLFHWSRTFFPLSFAYIGALSQCECESGMFFRTPFATIYVMSMCVYILTVNAHFNLFGNYWRDTVGCDAQIGAHVQAWYSRYFQRFAIPFADYCGKSIRVEWWTIGWGRQKKRRKKRVEMNEKGWKWMEIDAQRWIRRQKYWAKKVCCVQRAAALGNEI